MRDFPLDAIIKDLKERNIDPIKFFDLFLKIKETVYFGAALKRIDIELDEYQTLILKILKPSIDKETKKARYRNSYKPSSIIFDKTTGEPITLPGFRDEYKRQFIQLAYIGLYHKTENAEKELLEHLNSALGSRYNDLSDINFDNRNKDIFDARDRLRVVANCFKHNQGIANSQVCRYYAKCTINKPIILNFVDFKKDIGDIKKYHKQLSLFLTLFSQRKSVEKLLSTNFFETDDSLKQSLIEINSEAKKLMLLVSKENIFKKKSRS